MIKIIADNKIPFLNETAFDGQAELIKRPGTSITAADVKDADALITRTRTHCNAELLAGSRVKFIATATIGFDHIDRHYCRDNQITWTNAPGCNSSSVAQYIASALLNIATTRQQSLAGKKLGIIGVGNVGSKVAKVGEALGMELLLNDPPRELNAEDKTHFVSLEQLLTEADFVTLHVPLETDGPYPTYHLADRQFFARMRHDACFINSSRGAVCDNNALKKAIVSGEIGAAILDVWENEPAIDLELLKLVNYGTPHIAGYSADGKANGTAMRVNAVKQFFNLAIADWYPDDVPPPAQPLITLPAPANNQEKLLREAVNHSYNITADWRRLLENPAGFEQQRANYPLRREAPAYRIANAAQYSKELINALQALGFKVA